MTIGMVFLLFIFVANASTKEDKRCKRIPLPTVPCTQEMFIHSVDERTNVGQNSILTAHSELCSYELIKRKPSDSSILGHAKINITYKYECRQ